MKTVLALLGAGPVHRPGGPESPAAGHRWQQAGGGGRQAGQGAWWGDEW